MIKKIYLQLTPFFPSESDFRGGYIFDQVKAIEKNSNFKVIIIKLSSCFQPFVPTPYVYNGITVYPFKVIDFPSAILPGIFNKYNNYRLSKFVKKLAIENVDIIHSHVTYPAGALGVSLSNKYNSKHFIQHHGLDVLQIDNGRILSGLLKCLNQRFTQRQALKVVNVADLNIGVSQKVIDQFYSYPDFKNKQTYVLHNGVDIKKFYPLGNKSPNEKFTIGCIANFWPLKDQMTLLKAVKEISNSNIFVKFIGTGQTLTECITYVENMGLDKQVQFLSEVDHSKLNEFYNTLDLFVLPSFYEAFGCVYTEALSANVSIIAVQGQGIEEVLNTDDQDKCLIKKGDYLDLAIKIVNFMENPEESSTTYDLNINKYISTFINDVIYNK